MKPFPSSIDRASFELLDVIDFKWLMGREGHRVHVERLQGDPIYARDRYRALPASAARKGLSSYIEGRRSAAGAALRRIRLTAHCLLRPLPHIDRVQAERMAPRILPSIRR